MISHISPTAAPTGLDVTANLIKKNTSSFLYPLFLFSYKYKEQVLLTESKEN